MSDWVESRSGKRKIDYNVPDDVIASDRGQRVGVVVVDILYGHMSAWPIAH